MSIAIVDKLRTTFGPWKLTTGENGGAPPLNTTIASLSETNGLHTTFISQGGLVLKTPKVFNVFLGNWTAQRVSRLNAFTKDMLKSTLMDVLKQYGYISGTFVGSAVVSPIARNVTYISLNEQALAEVIDQAIENGNIPEPSENMCYMIYLGDEVTFSDNDLDVRCCMTNNNTAFGFHHYFETANRNTFIYSVTPSLSDECITRTCMSSPTCAMNIDRQNQEERITQVASHEYTEMVTNPTGKGWYDIKGGEEIADVCNGGTAKITVGQNVWNVQKQYSLNDDKATSGRLSCVSSTEATTPIEFYQRLTDRELLMLAGFAAFIMLISGIAYSKSKQNA